jgi:hypothetical protein
MDTPEIWDADMRFAQFSELQHGFAGHFRVGFARTNEGVYTSSGWTRFSSVWRATDKNHSGDAKLAGQTARNGAPKSRNSPPPSPDGPKRASGAVATSLRDFAGVYRAQSARNQTGV